MKKSSKSRIIALGRVSRETRATLFGNKVEFENPALLDIG